MTGVKMNIIVKMGKAGRETGLPDAPWRVFATVAAVLLLSVQIGLAFHSASHLHASDETEECNLCVLGSQFVAEPASFQDLETACQVVILPHFESVIPADSPLRAHSARGPPSDSV